MALPCKQAIKIIVIYFIAILLQKHSMAKSNLQFSQKLIILLVVFSVAGLPTYHVDPDSMFWGAVAVTSESGQGAIVQYMEYFYELTCEIGGCSWKILPQRLSPGVNQPVMMTLPPNYNC